MLNRTLRIVLLAAGVCALNGVTLPASAADTAPATASGIPLDAPWKVTIYKFAQEHFKHPAWGWQHSERNYQLGLELARGDGLTVDTDVLFAAAFLHDMAAFPPWAKKGMQHGDRAAETSVEVLRSAGFPMEKLPAVQAAERGHMYDHDPGSDPAAIVLHDADSLDFLGDVGIARELALLGEGSSGFADALKSLRDASRSIPPHLITRTGQRIGAERKAEMDQFLQRTNVETFGSTSS